MKRKIWLDEEYSVYFISDEPADEARKESDLPSTIADVPDDLFKRYSDAAAVYSQVQQEIWQLLKDSGKNTLL